MTRLSIALLACVTVFYVGGVCGAADSSDGTASKAPEKAKIEKTTGAKAQTAEEKEAAYTKTIEKRTADILALVDVKDEAKVKSLHDAIMNQYRFLNDWYEKNGAAVKALAKKNDDAAKAEIEKVKAPLKAQHEKFVAELAASLTPEQIEKVKNYIVKDKLPVTYKAYCEMLPKLTEEQKAKVYDILKQGREEAMDAGSAEEKTAIFGKYKGKVNIYLSGLGINMKQAEKEWQERIKAQRSQGGAGAAPSASPEKESAPASEKK
jgi:hypothetical protein